MDRKEFTMLALLGLLLVLLGAASQAATMPDRQDSAAEERAVLFEKGPCARSRLAQLQHNRQRMNSALSDGRRDSADVRGTAPFVRKTNLEVTCARLDFSLSDGSGNALGLRR